MAHPKFDPQKHHRRSIRLQGYDYSQEGAYFVTINTYQREYLFGEVKNGEMIVNDFGKIADQCWHAIPDHFPFVELGAHIIMPNHVHGIIMINETHLAARGNADKGVALLRPDVGEPHKINVKPGALGAIVRSYKSAVSYRIRKEHNATHIWQRNYYERIIRNEREMDNVWRYIESNPARWNEDDENLSTHRHKA